MGMEKLMGVGVGVWESIQRDSESKIPLFLPSPFVLICRYVSLCLWPVFVLLSTLVTITNYVLEISLF